MVGMLVKIFLWEREWSGKRHWISPNPKRINLLVAAIGIATFEGSTRGN